MRVPTTVLSAALGLVTAIAAAQAPSPDRMFVTSVTGNGNLSSWPAAEGRHGLDAANHICQKLADDAGLASAATFQAWLSDATTDAACNIKARGGHPPFCGSLAANNPGPWARTDGMPFARSIATLLAGEVLSPPLFDENGNHRPIEAEVFTGTDELGRVVSHADCEDGNGVAWNTAATAFAAFGAAAMGTAQWTYAGAGECSVPRHLYCFQHTIFGGPPFPPFERNGALMFRTSTTYVGELDLAPDSGGNPGRTGGDFICRRRAAAGGMPNPASFRAWLSSDGVAPADLLVYDGPFKRPDGIPVADSRADLLDGELGAPLAVTELLTHRLGAVWTATEDDGTRLHFVTETANCDDWASDDPSLSGGVGSSGAIVGWSYAKAAPGCTETFALYCYSETSVLFWTGFEERFGPLWRWAGVGSA